MMVSDRSLRPCAWILVAAAWLPFGAARQTDPKKPGVVIERFACAFEPRPVRYIRVAARSVRACPLWHKGAGGKAWIFTDEIVID